MVGRVLSYFKIQCFINPMDPDEMPHFVQSHPSLYCLWLIINLWKSIS